MQTGGKFCDISSAVSEIIVSVGMVQESQPPVSLQYCLLVGIPSYSQYMIGIDCHCQIIITSALLLGVAGTSSSARPEGL